MKKILLSLSLTALFAGYVTYQRLMGLGGVSAETVSPPMVSDAAPASLESSGGSPTSSSGSLPARRLARSHSDDDDVEIEHDDDDGNFIPPYNGAPITSAAPVATPAIPNTDTNPPPVTTNPPVSTPSLPASGKYRNGTYTGNVADAYYGYVQVKAIISGGKITDVQFLDYPNDRQNSVRINTYAMPLLTAEAIQVQSAQVDTISGASETSAAFRESLASALAKAKV